MNASNCRCESIRGDWRVKGQRLLLLLQSLRIKKERIMPENKRHNKPKAPVCKGAASGPLRPLPKVSNLVKMFNKKAIFDNKKGWGGRRGGVGETCCPEGAALSLRQRPTSLGWFLTRVSSRTSSVQTLTPCRSSGSSACPALCSAASETGFCRWKNGANA